MTTILLDLFYYYNSATNFPEFLKPEPLILRNPIIHRLNLSSTIINQINKSIIRLFLQDYNTPPHYYLYEDVTEEVTNGFNYYDNKGNTVRFLVPSSSGVHNIFLITPQIMNNINTYLLSPNINDLPSVINTFVGNHIFCRLYWFLVTYKNNTTYPSNYFTEFNNTINSLNSTSNLFIKTLEFLILRRIIVETFNKNVVLE